MVIKKRNSMGSLLPVYDIYHTPDYNPNTREYILFERGVNKAHVGEILTRLSKKYYLALSQNQNISAPKAENIIVKNETYFVHQCPTCFSIYDDRFGDFFNNIKANTLFETLPQNYTCPICTEPKANFKKLASELVV